MFMGIQVSGQHIVFVSFKLSDTLRAVYIAVFSARDEIYSENVQAREGTQS